MYRFGGSESRLAPDRTIYRFAEKRISAGAIRKSAERTNGYRAFRLAPASGRFSGLAR
jgi:hypothetical protein